jgi:hypothetical protein
MVIVDIELEGNKKPLYMDGTLYEQLTEVVKPSVQKKDFDYFIAIDGLEGSGKSVFGMQIAKILDPNFNLEKICYSAKDFIKAVINAKPYSCIVFDEAFTGLSSRSALSEINQLLVSLMMEMRQKNLFIILIMPSVFMLDKYAALHRAKGLFHVYMHNDKRGFWSFYNKDRLKYLYLNGKKYYDYSHTKPIIFGRFQNQYVIDEKGYREKKSESLSQKRRVTRADTYKGQRDVLFWILNYELKKSHTDIAKLCRKWKYKVDRSTISYVIEAKNKDLLNEGL